MKYLPISLLLVLLLALALPGAPQGGWSPIPGPLAGSGFPTQAVASGLVPIHNGGPHVFVTAPPDRALILRQLWMAHGGYNSTTVFLQRPGGPFEDLLAIGDRNGLGNDWHCEAFRLEPGDSLLVSGAEGNYLGWSGFWVMP